MKAWEQQAFDHTEECARNAAGRCATSGCPGFGTAHPPGPVVVEKRPKPKGTRKGAGFETVVAQRCGTERRVKNGNKDRGDLVLRSWVAEIFCPGRNKPLNLSQKMSEAKAEAENAGCPSRYCVIVRRTGYPVDEAYVVIPLWMARELGIPE